MNRRRFVREAATAVTGVLLVCDGISADLLQAAQSTAPRRIVTVGGRRIKTIDVHTHVSIPDAAGVAGGGLAGRGGGYNLGVGPERLRAMDEQGIDVQVLSINPNWYSQDRTAADRLIGTQNEKLAGIVAANPDRFAALASVALQHPDMAVQQLGTAFKQWRMRGAAIGCSVNAEELANPKFDPFWAKAVDLDAVIFIHPQPGPPNPRFQGNGVLNNVISNPLETTIALSHMIFEGVFDRFPALKICAAHAGGYLPSYSARMDHGCLVFPEQCRDKAIQKRPSAYLKQIYVDSMVFTTEGLRHLVAEVGASQIMLGTDYPYPWTTTAVDHILDTPGLSDADRIAMLGGTAATLLRI